jgi:cell division septal protein FtsQ
MEKAPRRRHLVKRSKTEKVPTAFLRKNRKKRKKRFLRSINPEKLKRFKFYSIVAIALIVIIGGGYLMFFSKTITIQEIVIIRDGKTIEHPSLTSKLSSFRGQQLFFLDTDEARQEILEEYPEIEKATIDTDLPDTLELHLVTYPQAANIINDHAEGTKKLIINTNGLTIADEKEDLTLPYIYIKTEAPIGINNQTLDTAKVDFIVKASTRFTELFDLEIREIIYKKTEREAHLKTERNFLVWLDIEKDLEQQLAKLKTVLPKLNIYNDPLEYIDLRISGVSGEKVIYK